MPCDAIRYLSFDFEAANKSILKSAAESLGWKVVSDNCFLGQDGETITISNGKAQVSRGNETMVTKLKVAYGKETINAACKKFGWQRVVKKPNQYEIRKGY